ncbi:MAG: hypothetical protein A2Z07_06220 [Armatimonadetes bacterium RBG_16_67_12]|nr:MAG: hypothetical protein A2Z07_06220 [Armatimonadetes bacterium RBG_16_67_12]
MPRRAYTESHMAVVVETAHRALARRDEIGGVRFVHEPPVLRHFTAHFAPVLRAELPRMPEVLPA